VLSQQPQPAPLLPGEDDWKPSVLIHRHPLLLLLTSPLNPLSVLWTPSFRRRVHRSIPGTSALTAAARHSFR
jgi:hypothetical protein